MSIEEQTGKGDRIGTPLEKKLEQIIPPFQRFTHDQTTGSILLIICTLGALLLANSSLDRGYESLLHTEIGLIFGGLGATGRAYLGFIKIIFGEDIGTRPLLLVSVLLVVMSVQFLTTGVLSEMMTRT